MNEVTDVNTRGSMTVEQASRAKYDLGKPISKNNGLTIVPITAKLNGGSVPVKIETPASFGQLQVENGQYTVNLNHFNNTLSQVYEKLEEKFGL